MHINSASRVRDIINQALAQEKNMTALTIWGRVFKIEDGRQSTNALAVTGYLNELGQEIKGIRTQLSLTHIPVELYASAITQLEEAINPGLLMQVWQASEQYLNQGTITSLSYWVAILPDEESEISHEDFFALIELLDQLESSLQNTTLPFSLVENIRRQIKLIRIAIEKYPILGTKVLKGAIVQGVGEILLHKDEFDGHESSEIGMLGKIWKVFTGMVDSAEKADKAIELTNKAVNFFNLIS